MVFVGVDTKDGPEHPCYSVTKRNTSISESLVQSIDSQGVLVPVIARKNGPLAEIAAGRRRLVNLRECNARRVKRGDEPHPLPLLKFEGTDAELLELMVSENIDREDESDVELARLASRLLKLQSRERVAKVCHCGLPALATLLKVLDLCPEVQEHTGRGLLLSRDAAVKLVDSTFAEQKEALKALKAEQASGVRVTANSVTRVVNPDAVIKPKGSEIKRLIDMLDKDVGRPRASRYFKVEAADAMAFARDLLRVCQGDLKASKIAGLTRVMNGTTGAEGE